MNELETLIKSKALEALKKKGFSKMAADKGIKRNVVSNWKKRDELNIMTYLQILDIAGYRLNISIEPPTVPEPVPIQ